jgi:hypothetical protein
MKEVRKCLFFILKYRLLILKSFIDLHIKKVWFFIGTQQLQQHNYTVDRRKPM